MRKNIHLIVHWFARITGWKWFALMTGIALLTACSGKSDKNTGGKDSIRDTERVTCYEPVVDTSVVKSRYSNTASKEDVLNLKDTSAQENEVPVQKCYVPTKPTE